MNVTKKFRDGWQPLRLDGKSPSVMVCDDAGILAVNAADIIAERAKGAIAERGRFLVALSGGSTPERTYRRLADPTTSAARDWLKTYVFFVDERFVSPEHEFSNYGMIRRSLLSRVPIPLAQVFPIPTQSSSAAKAAAKYEAELARFFDADAHRAAPPCFDLILLGLGEDGHTASLFPGAPALRIDDVWVTWTPSGVLPPPVDRITLTYRVLNAARHVVFLVSGVKKAAMLHDALEGKTTRDQCPAVGVRPAVGTLTWLVDRQSASRLTNYAE
jgi:6-phosphogluconolactonase